jgi:polysaccharide biosynthesis transport protein
MSHELPSLRSPTVIPGASGGGPQFDYNTVLHALRRWWLLAAPLGLVLATVAAATVYLITPKKYTAEAWLIIRDRSDYLLELLAREDPRKFLSNQIEMMRSPPILNPVAAIPAVANTPEIASESDPVQALKQKIEIVPKGISEFFVIRFTSSDPKSAALIPNEIAKAYLEMHRRTEGFRSNELIKLLNEELIQQQGVVEQARTAWYEEYKNVLGIAPDDVQLVNQSSRVAEPPAIETALQTQRLNAEVELALLDVQVRFQEAQPISKPTPAEFDQTIRNDRKIVQIESALAELDLMIEAYRDKAVPGHKSLEDLGAQRKRLTEQLANAQQSIRPRVEADFEKAAQARQEIELSRLRDKRDGLAMLIKSLDERLQHQQTKDDEQREVKRDVKDRMFKLGLLKTDFERAQQRYDALKKRIDTMGLEQRAPSRVDFYESAIVPETPDSTAPIKKIGMAAMAALLLPFALAVGIELLLRRVGSREEIEKGQIAVVGEITMLPRRALRTSNISAKPNWELQIYEESIDGLRTRLTLMQRLQGMRVLAVASSISREGKSSLAAQLAMSLSSASGEPTLLIDGDFRSPDIHRIFGIKRTPGLADVLCGSSTVEDAIQIHLGESLHLLAAGNLAVSPHRATGNGELAQLVERLKATYRYIIIDTPPVLAASEALVMARAADAAILCVRRDFSRVEQVKEAHSRLVAAGVNVAGAVLNGIPMHNYTFRYGSYYCSADHSQNRVDDVTSVNAPGEDSVPS